MIDDPAVRRTLRLAIGVSLALAIGQAINWSANSITAIIVSGLLTLPLPAPSLRLALSIVAKIGVSLLVGVLLLVPSLEQPLLGLFLVAVLLFATSWLASTGKIGPLDFTLLAMGLLIIPAIGATDIHLGVAAAKGNNGIGVAGTHGKTTTASLLAHLLERAGLERAVELDPDFATARIMLGFDRVMADNIMVGARLGYAFRGGPQPDSGNAFFRITRLNMNLSVPEPATGIAILIELLLT